MKKLSTIILTIIAFATFLFLASATILIITLPEQRDSLGFMAAIGLIAFILEMLALKQQLAKIN